MQGLKMILTLKQRFRESETYREKLVAFQNYAPLCLNHDCIILYLDTTMLVPKLPSGHSGYCSKKLPCGPTSILPIGHHNKRDICKSFDRIPQTANKGQIWLFLFWTFDLWSFYIDKSFLEPRKAKNLRHHHKSYGLLGRVGTLQVGPAEKKH